MVRTYHLRILPIPHHPVPNYPVELKRPDSPAAAENARKADYNKVGRVRCYNCGQIGHISYDCNVPQVRKACYLCGNSGHVSRDCPQKMKVVVCFHCRKTGHHSKECPDTAPSRGVVAADH